MSPPASREKSERLAAEAPGGRGPLTFQSVAGGVRVNNGDGPVTSGWGGGGNCSDGGSCRKSTRDQVGWSAASTKVHFHLFSGGLMS